MKKLLTLTLFILPFSLFAQLEYEQVFQVDSNITEDELFNRARNWFVDYYKNASKVLQVEDKESGELVGAAILTHSFKVAGAYVEMTIDYRISVKMKDGRYKVNVYNLYNSKCRNGAILGDALSSPYDGIGEITEQYKENRFYLNPKRYDEMKIALQANAEVIFQSLFEYMGKPIEKDEDW